MLPIDLEKQLEKQKEDIRELKSTFVSKTVALMLGGFGLVAALAWNEAIQGLVALVFGTEENSLVAKFIYAIVVTVILALVSMKLAKSEEK